MLLLLLSLVCIALLQVTHEQRYAAVRGDHLETRWVRLRRLAGVCRSRRKDRRQVLRHTTAESNARANERDCDLSTATATTASTSTATTAKEEHRGHARPSAGAAGAALRRSKSSIVGKCGLGGDCQRTISNVGPVGKLAGPQGFAGGRLRRWRRSL